MKRSQVNKIINETIEFIKSMNFYLPPFAYYSIEDWQAVKHDAQEIFDLGLGWDITDFGSSDFLNKGLTLFTIRNGKTKNKKYSKPYAEKIMMVRQNQITPFHYHWYKVEDIINRGGGDLFFKLYWSSEKDDFDFASVEVKCDGIKRIVEAGEELILKPGESLTLPQKLYHEFYAINGDVLAGEVSMVNDDFEDNKFYEKLPRFSKIEENEEPEYLLCNDYQKFLLDFKN